jgi:hypothetical protein
MKKKFELMEALSARREEVIEKHNQLKGEKLYNGTTLREFMCQFLAYMRANNPRSQKRFDSLFDSLLDRTYNDNLTILGDDYMVNKYRNTQFIALV